MKLRHLLFGLLAGVAFVACTNDNEPAGVTPVKGGDEVAVTRSYMKVDFVMPGATTRADFEAGTEVENKIDNGVLFFFDDSKLQVAAPFDLGADNANWTTQQQGTDANVEKESPVIVVLENPLKTPTAVLAVLNLGDKATLESVGIDGTKSLDELKAIVADYATEKQSKGKFVMSSSAYKGAKFDVAAEIATAQIYPTYEEAASAKEPVIIPVERVLAKVNVTAQESYDTGSTFKRPKVGEDGKVVIGEDGKVVMETVAIQAKITGFWIDNVAPESLLLKDISANKDGEVANGGDNDASHKRSYWAKSNYGGKNLQHFAYKPTTADKYVQENTGTDPTKVVVGATLTDEKGTALPLVKFKGKLYTKADFEVDVHGILAAKYFHYDGKNEKDEDVYSSIKASDITFTYVPVDGAQYKAQATIAYQGDAENLYKKSGTTYTKVTGDPVDFDAVDKAGFTIQLWDNGKTYYYVDIKHDATRKGVVRNHVYKLTVNSVTGLGTPVPFTDKEIIPVTPAQENETYISAKIQVLAWKIVPNTVDLGK